MLPVSIVIPAYNAEDVLADSIESILAQHFGDYELIVIDDCSRDSTWDIVQEYKKQDARLVASRNLVNLGIAGNRNKGVSMARGKYLAWQDADDISLPTRIERQFNFMESNHDVGIVGCGIEIFRNGRVLGRRNYPETDAEIRACIFRYSPIAQPASMIRVEALRRVGDYNLKYPPAEDLDMTFRVGRFYKFANLPEVLVRYRESDTSATYTSLKKMELSTIEIRKMNFNEGGYSATLLDSAYNFLHYVSIWIIPPKIKIRIFNFFRNE